MGGVRVAVPQHPVEDAGSVSQDQQRKKKKKWGRVAAMLVVDKAEQQGGEEGMQACPTKQTHMRR